MKVFLSHSSKDKWIARRIADDLDKIGVTSFLDEKDITTGESIDESIRVHLGGSNDFLLLLSPASIASHWVLIELGGALALKKRVIPILVYVGVNDVPKAISLKLARDISDIEKYYEELASRTGRKRLREKDRPKVKRVTAKKQTKLKFQAGQKVQIIPTSAPASFRDKGLDVYWVDE